MQENTEIQRQEQELARFALSQNLDERYLEYFGEIWHEAGIDDISKMTSQDAERVIQVLGDSHASPEFIKALLAQAVVNGIAPHVLEYFLESDIDGDGRTLLQEIFHDGTDPFEPDSPTREYLPQIAQSEDIELEI